MGRLLLLPIAVVAGFGLAVPALACDGLSDGPSGVVDKVVDDATLVLDSGIDVRLLGVKAPDSGGPRGNAPAEPLAGEAQAALSKLVLGQPVRLGLDDEETDRYGRMEAQVFLDRPDGAWVQQQLVAAGFARAYALPKGRRCAAELIAAEAVARAGGLGIWGNPYYSVADAGNPEALAGRDGRFELIEGEVEGVGAARDRIYLDFGRTWKTDVTATIDRKTEGLFADAGIDPSTLKGRRVRVRGWLQSRDGPLIELSLPEQIEVLDSE